VWGEISDRAKFSFDATGEYFMEATTFLLTGKHLEYLVCFLNSSLAEYMFSKIGTTTGVGTVRWKKFKLLELYVPVVSEAINRSYAKYFEQDIGSALAKEIDERIFRLCGLTPEEVDYITAHCFSS